MAERDGIRVIARNRKARHEYEVLEQLEAGLVLLGAEVKSLRDGKASFVDAFGRIDGGEAWLHNLHISPYDKATIDAPDPVRPRKLLLNKREIRRLAANAAQKGLTVVPVRLYISDHGLAKVVVALAKGKQQHDKRDTIAQRDAQRSMARARKQMYED